MEEGRTWSGGFMGQDGDSSSEDDVPVAQLSRYSAKDKGKGKAVDPEPEPEPEPPIEYNGPQEDDAPVDMEEYPPADEEICKGWS